MNKVVQDGKVAVILNNYYGTPWYNDHFDQDLVFDPYIVDLILEKQAGKMLASQFLGYLKAYLTDIGMDEVYVNQSRLELTVEWVREGSSFIIHEYDGLESIVYEQDVRWFNA
jgi:hypothetical protein